MRFKIVLGHLTNGTIALLLACHAATFNHREFLQNSIYPCSWTWKCIECILVLMRINGDRMQKCQLQRLLETDDGAEIDIARKQERQKYFSNR